MNKHSVRKFLAALSLILGAGSVLTVGVRAQTASPAAPAAPAATASSDQSDQTVQLQKYVVTGSNIPLAGDSLSVPVTIITSDQIETSGDVTNMLDLLRKVSPAISGIGTENATISTATTYGGNLVNLHGLSVLVLVNGQRIASDAAEAVGGDRFTDLNMIPPSAVDHIETLEDGGSAIYGSDAVGGVINIILKHDYNGWEATSHYGFSPNTGHYSERDFSLTGGVSNDKTSITVSAEYSQSDPIYFSQRTYTNPYYANDYIPGVIDIYSLATGNDEDYLLAPGHNAPPGGGQYTIDQLVAMGYYIDMGSDSSPNTELNIEKQVFNFATGQTLISSDKRANFTANVTHKIFGENLQYFGDFLYSNNKTLTSLNAQPLYPYLSDPYTDGWYNGGPPVAGEQFVPISIPGNPFSQAYIDQGATGNAGYGVDVHDRLIQYPRIFTDDSTNINFTNGLKGTINDDWSWEVSNTYSRYTIDYANQNVIDATNFYAALENGTLNPFAVVQAPGVLPGDILGTATMNGISTLSDLNFILRGTPAHLASGDVGVALGATYTRETLDATADLNTEDRGWVNSPSILPIDKSRETGSFFGEVEVPIIGKGNKVPGVNLLNLDVAGRVDEYGGTVGTSKVPKVSLKYEPVDDQFSFRASAGKSFIAPQMYDLYGPINIGSSNSINYYPLNSTTELNQVQFESVSGANPALKPSTATTWTAGFGFTPEAVKGFSLTVDYFSTHQLGLPGSPDQQTVIQSVEDLGAASPYASFIHFGNPAGPGPTAPGQISGHPKSAVWIVADLDNDGGSWTKGLDATAEYVLPKREYGKFTLESTATIYTDATFAELPTLPYYSYLGDVSQNQGTVPRWRTFSTVDWKYRGWGATINHTFVPSLADVGPGGAGATAPVHVSSYSQFDATVKYSFGHDDNPVLHYFDGLTVRVGVNNVFNVNPPIALNAETETNADVGFYDGAIGRMYYVDATYKF